MDRELAQHMVSNVSLAEASRTLPTIAGRLFEELNRAMLKANDELNSALGKAIGSVSSLASHSREAYRSHYRAKSNEERLALEWETQQEITVGLARKLRRRDELIRLMLLYCRHDHECPLFIEEEDHVPSECCCGLETLYQEFVNGIR